MCCSTASRFERFVDSIRTVDGLIGDAGERVFVVLLSVVVSHGDMNRKGNRDASRRGGSKT
jgi:hypothetical protein